MDVFSPEKRSSIMRGVKATRNSSTELRLIALFKARGIKGWRRKYPTIGKPDFVFLRQKIAVFADGCFWHGHDCRNTRPAQNAEYWQKKRDRNQQRDREITRRFENRGWRVIRVWECELRKGDCERLWQALRSEPPADIQTF